MRNLVTISFVFFWQIIFCQTKGIATYVDWNNNIKQDSAIKVVVAYQFYENGHVTFKADSDSSILPFKDSTIIPFKKIISYKPNSPQE